MISISWSRMLQNFIDSIPSTYQALVTSKTSILRESYKTEKNWISLVVLFHIGELPGTFYTKSMTE